MALSPCTKYKLWLLSLRKFLKLRPCLLRCGLRITKHLSRQAKPKFANQFGNRGALMNSRCPVFDLRAQAPQIEGKWFSEVFLVVGQKGPLRRCAEGRNTQLCWLESTTLFACALEKGQTISRVGIFYLRLGLFYLRLVFVAYGGLFCLRLKFGLAFFAYG